MASIYYKTKKDSETGKKFQQLIERAKIVKAEITEFVLGIGATEEYAFRGIMATGLCAVKFENEPDSRIWKNFQPIHGYFTPRRKTKEGKALASKFESLEYIDRSEIDRIVGINDFRYNCGSCFGNDEYFGFILDSSWDIKKPDDLEEILASEYEKLSSS